jgi:hypothetical protein
MRVLKPDVEYFVLVFAAELILGPIWELWVIPLWGQPPALSSRLR